MRRRLRLLDAFGRLAFSVKDSGDLLTLFLANLAEYSEPY